MSKENYSIMQLRLLEILKELDKDYGVPILRRYENLYGGMLSVGSMYVALDKLEENGLVVSSIEDPGEHREARGGRAKKFFSITDGGIAVLTEWQRQQSATITGVGSLVPGF